MSEIFAGKAFLVVTGASRGIGRAIAEKFASHLKNDSKVLLMARNLENLEKIADGMPRGLIILCKSVDFGQTTTKELQDALNDALRGEKPESFNQAIIVHCAAVVDYTRTANDLTDFSEWQTFFNVNMFSSAVLNGLFMKTFESSGVKKYVVNVCSYWGLTPDVYVSSYCAAKAAKDMFFKSFALENPDVSVLNYLPGLVDTEMLHDAYKKSKSEELVTRIKSALENNTVSTPEKTAECLVGVLKQQNYKSGDYVDFQKLNTV
ncbi:sepiapterin reductase [Copidosoma floridanum]|uniref:sepiapterin reductase n=1 Tax=Copidosoma floridanum TaxID=29053 RepID=UPI0006C9A26A|nr:sepiapterin reductase [Copidosoma floridanum]